VKRIIIALSLAALLGGPALANRQDDTKRIRLEIERLTLEIRKLEIELRRLEPVAAQAPPVAAQLPANVPPTPQAPAPPIAAQLPAMHPMPYAPQCAPQPCVTYYRVVYVAQPCSVRYNPYECRAERRGCCLFQCFQRRCCW
jgi:transposase InsO family protein